MGLWNCGERKSKEKGFDDQLRKAFPNEEGIEEIAEAGSILTFEESDDEIEDALGTLESYE